MRHRAFTLVEVLAALSIMIVTGLLGGYSYGRLTTHLSEQQFCVNFSSRGGSLICALNRPVCALMTAPFRLSHPSGRSNAN